ncbi:MAG TPA: hypothetical protein VKN99_26420 [Polyangia bacterium]|nr:hypothetical protein [Polyangia bacterium]
MRAASRLGLLVLASGCVEHFAMPMTASQLAQSPSGAALVAYLGQPDASATVCDLDAAGAHLTIADQDVRAALVDGLAAGRVEPPIWRSCVDAILRTADRESAASLLDAIGRSYRKLLADSHFERDPAMQARVAAMHEVYLERTNGVAPHDRVMSELLADLRQALDKRRLGPIAVRYGADLLATVDLERGNLRGRPVDVAVLDQLLAAGDEGQLRRCGQRLPDPGLRTEARRRVVRLHIQASPYPEVHENAAAVEQAVLKTGSNRISAAEHRPLRGWIDAARLTVRGVLLRQNVSQQMVTLLGWTSDRSALSVLPQLPLAGALEVELEGIGRPVTLCLPAEALDPSPCLAAADVRIASPLMYLDRDGAFHFVEHVAAADGASLAQKAQGLVLPIAVAGRPLLTLDWDLRFERPADLVLSGPEPGGAGPDLHVRVGRGQAERLIYSVKSGGWQYWAVVEPSDAAAFHVESRGGGGFTGLSGSTGSDGSSGLDGTNASCPMSRGSDGARGGDGSRGGTGGAGGPGGRGGDIDIEVMCASRQCGDLVNLVRLVVSSVGGAGGAGGAGGSGGSGGKGGEGGSGTTCTDSDGHTTSLSGGSTGSRGSDGPSGFQGPAGVPGAPGQVRLHEVRQHE